MNPSDRNPLRESPGKGDKPRNCFNKKFRNNYDAIDWNNNVKAVSNNYEDIHMGNPQTLCDEEMDNKKCK